MLYTEEAARENVRNRDGRRVFYLAKDDTLTPGARDWLKGQKIDILPAHTAKPENFRMINGGFLPYKPEYMTHLHGDVLVEKTHPRIVFRGTMDTLEAEILLTMKHCVEIREKLQQVLVLAREIVRCEVLEQPLGEYNLGGMRAEQLRERSHFPQKYYKQPHFMPKCEDEEQILLLNRLRTAARQAEISAIAAFLTPEGLSREDIVKALNRMSSFVYILMIERKAEGKM